MIRPPIALLLTILAAAATQLLAAAPADAASSCPTVAPSGVKLVTNEAGTRATVSWRIPRRHPAKLAYRVARDGAVVGQTSGRSMRVALAPSRAARITVTAVVRGTPTRCAATVRVRGRGRAPGRVTGLSTTPRRRGRIRVSWEPATPGAHAVRSYRVLRDGRIVTTLRRRSVTVRVPARGADRLQVAAVDTGGRVGRRSQAVTLRAGHVRPQRPPAPAASHVTETAASLSWGRARAIGSRIRGYRVVRGGRTVRFVKGTRARVTGLAPSRRNTFRIVAVDALGWTSAPSQRVTIRPGHRRPGRPGAPTATAVTDTAVSLSWAPSALPEGSKLRGYRLMRDGVVVRQFPTTQADVGNLAPKSAHDWTVAAVDTRGYVSDPSPATRVLQGDPPPATGGVHAYLLASTDASFAAFRKHYRQIGVVYPTFFECDPSGQVRGADNPLIVSFARDRKVKVLPRFYCQRTAVLHRILTDPAQRTAWLDAMVSLADEHGWDGVNVDFEAVAAEDRDLLTAFIADLADRLHARGKLLSQAVSAKVREVANHPRSGAFDYAGLSQYADYIFVMAWGIHWATSAPGAQDDFTWVRQVRDYVATMPRKDKFVMGTMLYGMDWPSGGGPEHPAQALHYTEIEALVARVGVQPVYDPDRRAWHLAYTADGVPHDLWYSDAPAVGDRVALAREQGLGVGFWRIGQEDERIWADPRLPGAG